MKKQMFRTNYAPVDCSGEVNTKKSKTTPKMSLTVREIMNRYACGNPPDIRKRQFWNDNPNFDNFDETVLDFDYADATDMLDRLNTRQEEINENRKKLKRDEEIRIQDKMKALQERIKELEQKPE